MAKKSKTKRGTARDAILAAATQLFYEQGYHTTGVQQIIDDAGISKATFYAHFPSKEDLCLAYLRSRDQFLGDLMKDALLSEEDAVQRFLKPLDLVADWLEESDYRGCNFANVAVEITDAQHPLRKEIKYHCEGHRAVLRDLAHDLIAADPERFGHLDAEDLADSYYLIELGAIITSQQYNSSWPLEHAKRMTRQLIGIR